MPPIVTAGCDTCPADTRILAEPFSLNGITMEENQTTKKPMNKTEILAALSEATGLTKQQVGGLFDELTALMGKNLGNEGPGVFAIPGLLQVKVVRKPATEECKGSIPSPRKRWSSRPSPPRMSSRSSP